MKKQKKKKLSIKKIILIIILIFFINHLYSNQNNIYSYLKNIFTNTNYKIIKQDNNPNYSGIGQEKVNNQDGYFTTFTSTSNKKYIEYKQNGTSSWSNNTYWGGTMKENACGITALSIILSGYNKNYNPEDLRNKYYPKLNYDNLSKELSNTFGIENSDFYYDSVSLSQKNIQEHLESERPVLICVWDKPSKNRWTQKSHYMVLLATDGNMVYISNPNGDKNSYNSSGWYKFNEVIPYIAKALFVESY